jgi:hypothetical protein
VPDRPRYLNSLGVVLRHRYSRTGAPEDLREAVDAFVTSCEQGLRDTPETCMAAATNWGTWATERGQWEDAARAFQYGIDALDGLFSIQLLLDNKEIWLREARDLSPRAAFARIHLDDHKGAVAALERGRARMLSEALDLDRADTERLAELGRADLVARYRRIANTWTLLADAQRKPRLLLTEPAVALAAG